jgi:predicted nucleic acid-binding protein
MSFVIDASVTMSWYFAEEGSPAGKLAFEQLGATGAEAPVLWWFEVRNALVVNERRGRLDMAATVGVGRCWPNREPRDASARWPR